MSEPAKNYNRYIRGAIIRALAQLVRDTPEEEDGIDRGELVQRAKYELDFLRGLFPKHVVEKRKNKRIKVNRNHIDYNKRHGVNRPPLSMEQGGEPVLKGHQIIAKLPSGVEAFRVIYRPDKPLGCGATVWIETNLDVEALLDEEMGEAHHV